ncbi:hypothetical protein [Photobacterium sp. 1_MG-2023]|uniref:hypothetical protein n=1 Tax=Photobacterium sp. 1_MG-2023 TaxID=3062646 RepID=UPI0026E1D3B3|nr:hypothetical protein [Photobacterium sp. 1_MG-2023]MDO6707567.1 hypothetical protein [Photobacterium sp. 1_MG-2023]
MKFLLLILLLMTSLQAKADFSVKDVDPSLVMVSYGFQYRILVYSICSPEHCWSETYLQSVSLGTASPEILCSRKLNEIALGHVISDIHWEKVNGVPKAQLSASAAHGGFEPRVIQLMPSDDCSYQMAGYSESGF